MLPPLSRISNVAALLNCRQGVGFSFSALIGGRDSRISFSTEAFEGSLHEDQRQFIE